MSAEINVRVFVDSQRHVVVSIDVPDAQYHEFVSLEDKIGDDAVVSPSVLKLTAETLNLALTDPAIVSALHRNLFFDKSCGGCG